MPKPSKAAKAKEEKRSKSVRAAKADKSDDQPAAMFGFAVKQDDNPDVDMNDEERQGRSKRRGDKTP